MHYDVVERLLTNVRIGPSDAHIPSDVAQHICRELGGCAHPCALVVKQEAARNPETFLFDNLLLGPSRCDF
eukprot:279034-Prymnesium_polylepis.1